MTLIQYTIAMRGQAQSSWELTFFACIPCLYCHELESFMWVRLCASVQENPAVKSLIGPHCEGPVRPESYLHPPSRST